MHFFNKKLTILAAVFVNLSLFLERQGCDSSNSTPEAFIIHISVDSNGVEGDDRNENATISPTGRYA